MTLIQGKTPAGVARAAAACAKARGEADNQLGERYVPALDGWRGVAILSVLLWHLWPWDGGAPAKYVSFGWMGVDLFFVLSGFLITRILLAAKGKPGYFRNFYARRTLRIVPIYYGILLAVYVVWPALRSTATLPHGARVAALLYVTNVWSAWKQQWFPAPSPFAGSHLWSLAVEEQFYLIWPAVVLVLSHGRLMAVCALCVAVSVAMRVILFESGRPPVVAYVLTPAHMDGLAVGAALAVAATVPRWTSIARLACYAVLPVCVVGLAVIATRCRGLDVNLNPLVQTVGTSLAAPLFGSLLFLTVALPTGNVLDGAMRFAPLRWLGKYSYGLYLYHGLAGAALGYHLRRHLLDRLGGGMASPAVYFLATSSLCLLISILSFHLIEQPLLRLKRFFPEPMSPDPL
jgi:peptidoglycan/LPS O-acetylase OafA/YrhL